MKIGFCFVDDDDNNKLLFNPTNEQINNIKLEPYYAKVEWNWDNDNLIYHTTIPSMTCNKYLSGFYMDGSILPVDYFSIKSIIPATGYCQYILERVV